MMTSMSFRRLDRLEMNREPVREEQRLALAQVRLDVLLVNRRDRDVGHGDENHVGLLDRLGGVVNLETEFLRGRNRFAAGIKANDDLDAAFLQVQRVGMALRAKANHGHGLVLQYVQVTIFVRIDFCGHRRG